MPTNRHNELRSKWLRIERGEEKDDYKNPFLSHFGFYDDGRPYYRNSNQSSY
jgi:hypothetical protein